MPGHTSDGRLQVSPGKRSTKKPHELALSPSSDLQLKWAGPKAAPNLVVVHPGHLRPVPEVYGVAFGAGLVHGGGIIQVDPEGAFAIFYPTNGLKQAGELKLRAFGSFPSSMRLVLWFMRLNAEGEIIEGSVDAVHLFAAGGSEITVTIDTSTIEGGHQLRLDLEPPEGKRFDLRSVTLSK